MRDAVAGGTVQAGGGVYLERRADDELLAHCRAGDFTYILTSRQMGKSSLMIRTAERLFAEGEQPVVIDLTEFGAQTTAEQWYKGFLTAVEDQLVLSSAEAKAVAAEFADALQYQVTVEDADIRVSSDGRSATVTAGVHRLVAKSSRVRRDDSVRVFTMEKRRDGWTILSVR